MQRIVYDCDKCGKESDCRTIKVVIGRSMGENDYSDVDLCPNCMSSFAANLLNTAYDMDARERILKDFVKDKKTAR